METIFRAICARGTAAVALSLASLSVSATGVMGATSSGTITINATIVVGSQVPANSMVTAGGSVDEYSSSGSNEATRNVPVAFKPGKTAHATITIPYTWTTGQHPSVTVYLDVSPNVEGVPFADVSRTIAVPANGSHTTVNMTAAI